MGFLLFLAVVALGAIAWLLIKIDAKLQAIEQLRCGGQGVRFLAVAAAQFHQGVGLFDARREDAPGPVVFETSADQAGAVGQQGRGQAVAGMAFHDFSVEREAESPRSIDMTAVLQAPRLIRHESRSPLAGAVVKMS